MTDLPKLPLPTNRDPNSIASSEDPRTIGSQGDMQTTMLVDLYAQGGWWTCSRWVEEYGWLHQSASSALAQLFQRGLVVRPRNRKNPRDRDEHVYSLNPAFAILWATGGLDQAMVWFIEEETRDANDSPSEE